MSEVFFEEEEQLFVHDGDDDESDGDYDEDWEY